jgi:succinoglycan biosynthesis transport protein ExoP
VSGDSRPAIKVSVVEAAIAPTNPVSPDIPTVIGVAIAFGLMLGIGLAFVVEQLDTTIKGKRDLHADRQVLVEIPKGPKATTVAIQDADGPVGEAFRRLRSTIQFIDVDERVHSILVTSAEPGEGKSTVAANLAVAYAQAETNTILVEADLRNPVLQTILPIEGKPGLADFLTRPIRIEDITLQTRMRRLKVIPVGAMVPNPSELLASDRMRWFIDQLCNVYSTVIIDSAPLLPVADTISLCTRVDGIIVVARGGQTKRRPLDESLEAIYSVGGNVLGVVLNAVKPERGTSGYYPYPYPYARRRTTA